jgi:hypothetical protein
MKEIILDVLKKMRTDYGNNENIIFAQDSDLEVVVDELLTAINYTHCCTELKCEHEPKNLNKKHTSCKKCGMHLQMKP